MQFFLVIGLIPSSKNIFKYLFKKSQGLEEFNLKTNISEITIAEVSKKLNTSTKTTVAICNANTLVRSYQNSKIQEKINSFDIKAPDGFPVAKASKIIYKNKYTKIENGIQNFVHWFKKYYKIK